MYWLPGMFLAVSECLGREANINVLYFYTFLGRGESGQPIVIIGVDKTAEDMEALKRNWVQTFGKEIYSL